MEWIRNLNLRGRIMEISQRFPLVLAFAFLTTITLILTIDDDSGKLFRWPVAGFIGFLAVLAWTLYCETLAGSKKIFWSGSIIILLLLGLFYYLMPSEINKNSSCFWYFTLGLSIILHLSISVIPFWRGYDKIAFVNFNIGVFNSWMQSTLYALLLYFALCIAIVALDNLFGINIKSIFYFKIFIIITGLIQSTLFLSDIPEHFADRSLPGIKSVWRVIVYYLFIPVTLLYGLIIYAYFFRVILTSHEIVEWTFVMILWYLGVGMLSWLLAGYFENPEGNILIRSFRQWFFTISVLPCVFLCISLYQNIGLEGVKEEFYLSALAASFIATILFIFLSGISKDQRLIPIIGIFFSIVGFWSGPFSICEVPVKNQQNRLISDMRRAGLIQNGVLDIDTLKSYQDSAGMIIQKLYYLESRDALGFLKDYDSQGLIKEEGDSINVSNILSLLRLNSSDDNPEKYFDYTHKQTNSYDINGFEKIIPITTLIDKMPDNDYLYVENSNIILYLNGEKTGEMDINKELIQIADNVNSNNIIDSKINGYKLRIIVNSASGQRDGNVINNLYLTGYVLLKKVDK